MTGGHKRFCYTIIFELVIVGGQKFECHKDEWRSDTQFRPGDAIQFPQGDLDELRVTEVVWYLNEEGADEAYLALETAYVAGPPSDWTHLTENGCIDYTVPNLTQDKTHGCHEKGNDGEGGDGGKARPNIRPATA